MLAVSEGLIDARNASNLKFSGITFKHSTWLAPSLDAAGRSGGFVEVQSGAHYVREFEPQAPRCGLVDGGYCGDCLGRGPAALTFRGVHRSEVAGCRLEQLGADGLALRDGSQYNRVSATEFRDVSASAIAIGTIDACPWSGPPDCFGEPSHYDSGNVVSDCRTADTAVEYRGSAAVFVAYARETTIAYNELGPTSWSAISFGWGWSHFRTHSGNSSIVYTSTLELTYNHAR